MIRWRSRTFLKYLVVQAPGWFLLVGVLLFLRTWAELPLWLASGLFGLAVAKDLVLYPFLGRAYEGDPRTGGERLVGSRGAVAKALAPQGYIRVRGELWLAKAQGTLPEGTPVRICSARGLTLTVEPE